MARLEREEEVAAEIGDRIRSLRRRRGLTLKQVAQATDLSHPFLSQVERGRTLPSITSLYRIAFALGTSPSSLLNE